MAFSGTMLVTLWTSLVISASYCSRSEPNCEDYCHKECTEREKPFVCNYTLECYGFGNFCSKRSKQVEPCFDSLPKNSWCKKVHEPLTYATCECALLERLHPSDTNFVPMNSDCWWQIIITLGVTFISICIVLKMWSVLKRKCTNLWPVLKRKCTNLWPVLKRKCTNRLGNEVPRSDEKGINLKYYSKLSKTEDESEGKVDHPHTPCRIAASSVPTQGHLVIATEPSRFTTDQDNDIDASITRRKGTVNEIKVQIDHLVTPESAGQAPPT